MAWVSDASSSKIEVRPGQDDWGPFKFDITNEIPADSTIQSCTVKAYLGVATPEDDLDDFTDISDDLLSDGSGLVWENMVYVYFEDPANDDYRGERVTLVFSVVIEDSRTYPFYFSNVYIM